MYKSQQAEGAQPGAEAGEAGEQGDTTAGAGKGAEDADYEVVDED